MKKHTIRILILAAAGILPASLQAQAVPAFINYQGRVADSSGVGLGTGTPVNRKVLFRLFDASTAGTRLWTEEQTVTIANGEFSVLLGNGVTATGTASGESRPALDGVFTSGTSARFLELTVDNGDNAFTAADQPISPRQRITSTAYTFRAQSAESIAVGSSLQMGTNADSGLGFYGTSTSRLFGGQNINGPVLYGSSGGALGSVSGATQNLALRWDASNNVTTTGDLTINGKAIVRNNDQFAPPANGVTGSNGMRFILYPGTASTMPFGFGIADSALFSSGPVGSSHKWFLGSSELMLLNASGLATTGISATGNIFAAGSIFTATGNISTTSGTIFAGGVITGGSITTAGALSAGSITTAGDLAAAKVNFSPLFDPPAVGVTGSAGTKINLYPGTATETPYGTGLEAGFLYDVVPSASGFKWYAGTSVKMTLTSDGRLGIGTAAPMSLTPVAYPSPDWSGFHVVATNAVGLLQSTTTSRLHFRNSSSLADNRNFAINSGSDKVEMSWLAESLSVRKTCLTFDGAGNVGIGTSTPRAPLEVAGFSSVQTNRFNITYTGDFDPADYNSFTDNTAILCPSGGVAARYFLVQNTIFTSSDERTKIVLGGSDAAKDLQILQQIAITDYRYKDVIGMGAGVQKKVIAQQVEKVFPQAVIRRQDVLPDILKLGLVKDGWVQLATDLKAGEKVCVLLENQQRHVLEVLEAEKTRFRVQLEGQEGRKVFVHGREVKDFRSVDYDAISMLNVSATQQLKKEKDAEVAALKAENEKLRLQLKDQAARLVALEAAEHVRDAKLAVIEKLLGSSEKPTARTVSLKKDSGAE